MAAQIAPSPTLTPALLTASLSAPRRHPEWSDVALFACAVLAVAFVRRALRRRFPRD